MEASFTHRQVTSMADSSDVVGRDDAGTEKLEALETLPSTPDEDSFKLTMDHKRSVAKVSLFIGMPLFLAMAIKNFIRGDNIMTFFNCMELLILIVLGFVIMRRIEEKSEYRIYSILFRLFFGVMGVSLFYDIGSQSNFSRIEWCYIYPVLVFLAVGVKEGAIWVSIFYGILAFSILTFDLQGITLFQIQELRTRFLVSFFAVCMLSLFLEHGFRRIQQRLLHHQSILKESENRYRQAYEQLNMEMQERKRAEEALLNAAQQWRTTFDGISDIVCLLDLEGRILRCNKAMTNLLGKPFSEIIGRPHWEIIHGTTAPIKESPFELMRETRRKEIAILPIGDRWFNIAVDPLLDITGSLIGAVHIMSDITEHKQAEEVLQESEDRYRDLVERSQYLICTHDLKGQILSVNQEGAKLLGYDQRSLLNKNIRDLLLVREFRDEFDKYLDTIREHGVAKGLMLLQTATGERRIWEYNNTLRTEGVTAPIVRAIAHDVTDHIQAEKAVTRLSQENAIMAEIGRIISSTLNIEEVYERFFEEARKLIPFDRISINIVNPGNNTASSVYVAGIDIPDRGPGDITPLKGTAVSECVRTRSSLLIQPGNVDECLVRFPALLPTFQAGLQSIMFVPLISKDQVIGALSLRSTKAKAYTDRDVRLAESIGNQIAGAIANAQLFAERKQAEEHLRENQETLQAIMDSSPVAISWADMKGNIEYNNRKFRELFGYTVEDIPTIAEWRRLAYPDPAYRETVPSLVVMLTEAQKQGREVTPIELTITCKDGSTRYVEQMGAFASNRILAIYKDITERKLAEEALRQSEEKYRTILEDIEEGYFEVDLAGNFTFINDSACSHTGYSREELIGMNNQKYVDEENAKKIFEAFNRIYRTGEPGRVFDYEIIRKDGTKRQVEVSASLRKDSSAKPIGFRGVTRDITERRQAEEALRQSEERYRTILENMQEVYYEIDLAGNFIFLNEAFYEHLGYTKEELIGKNSRQYQDETTAKTLYQAYNRLYRTGEPIKAVEAEWISKDGAKRTYEMSASLIRDSEGKPIGFRGVSRDVTGRKEAEEALRRSEEEAKRLAHENAIMAEIGRIISSSLNIDEVYERFAEEVRKLIPFDRIVINNIDIEKGTVINVYMAGKGITDRKANEIYPLEGSGNAEMVRTKSSLLIQTEDFNEYKDHFPMLLSTFQAGFRSIMNVLLFSKGRIIGGLLLRSLKPYAYTDKDLRLAERVGSQIAGAIANAQLFIERKRAEEAATTLSKENAIMAEIGRIISSTLNIEEVYERFAEEVRKLIPFDRIALSTSDPESHSSTMAYVLGVEVEDRNQGAVFSLTSSFYEEIIAKRSGILIQTEDESEFAERYPTLFSTFRAGIRSILSVPLISKDQVIGLLHFRSLKPNAYTETDLRLAEKVGNQIAGAIANAQLFIERKRAEEEKTSLQEQLRQSQKMEAIGKLAGGVAHDFNNLLTVIHGYSELILNSLDQSSRLRQDVQEILNASERASSLTRQLLAFSRKQVLQPKVLDLNDHVPNMDKMLRRMIGEDVELVTLLAKDLGRIKADPGQIEQVILNLVVNAKDAMLNGGKLTIETANVKLDESYARSHIGVAPGHYVMLSVSDTGAGMTPEIKERIFEPFFTTKEKGKGTGLGLSTVYGIVQQSGGNVWVYSEPGVGTTFKIYLPTIEEDTESLRPTALSTKPTQGFETILVVEDEETVRKLACTVLQNYGYTVLEAPNGEEALRIVQGQNGNPIHLMVTDVVMPGMSGRQLAERLVSLCPKLKVLYMSGYTDNAIVHHGVLDPGIAYIQKPFASDALASKVREILDGE